MSREEDLVARVRARRDELLRLCGELVAQPSVNPPGDVRGVADVVVAYLERAGLTPEVHALVPEMPSVVARLDTGRPGPHVVWNAHMDTMPAGDPALWSVPIHETSERDGRLYGLGMGNMKGALAGMLVALAVLAEDPSCLSGRVTLTAVSDEVVFGEHGTAHLLETLPDLLGDAVLSGEGPGFGRLAVAEKGVCWLELVATADGGHSSAVRPGESASARLARAVLAVDALTGRRTVLPPELAGLEGDGTDPGLLLTANVGTVAAGTFVGQIATSGTAQADLRLPPGTTMAALQAEVAEAAGTGVDVRRLKGWDANWTSPDDALVRVVARAVEQVTGEQPELAVRLPASDASRWRRHGVPAICYGPQPTLSAGIDDHALVEQLVDCAAVYALATSRYTRDAAGAA